MNSGPEPNGLAKLDKKIHVEKLIESLTNPLSSNYEKLVPAQTWSVYWITHALSLLDQSQFLSGINGDIVKFIGECAHEEGGYGGGPGQIAHLATTFAAVNSLISATSEEALDSIDRAKLVRFLHRMKQPDGSFSMHDDGEIDSRATYCALAVLRCLNIQDPILTRNSAEWILSCQTYEGGFGSVPDSEAHGGYTFCCVASLCLLNQLHRADLLSLLRWLTNKQMTVEGGFCGRSNKLVDSCYSYWQGAVFPLIHPFLGKLLNLNPKPSCESKAGKSDTQDNEMNSGPQTRSKNRAKEDLLDTKPDKLLEELLFDCGSLQDYILNKCQSKSGMLRDKPGASPDFYHTCYALSGLSLSQHQPNGTIFDIGNQAINIVGQTHPLFNLTPASLEQCFYYYRDKKIETFLEEEEEPEVGESKQDS